MDRGNSSNQNSQGNFDSSQPNFSSSQPNFSTSQTNFSSQPSTQNFGLAPNIAFFPQVQNSQFPPNFQFSQFPHIYQNAHFPQGSQFPFNIPGGQFPGNMQFSQFAPFSTQSENDVTIVPPPTQTGSSRRQLWSIEDDKMLARAHATISQDSAIGNDQSGLNFWKRIEKYYNDNHPNSGPRRTAEKLKSHWGLIRRLTLEFHHIYCKLQAMRPSGSSDTDLMVRATEEYKQKYNRDKFGYEHVWGICKDLPSWAPSFIARQLSLSKSSTNQTSSESVEGGASGSVEGSGGGSEENFPRPMGKKAAKRKAKERDTDDNDDIQAMLQQQVQMFEKYQKIKIEREERKMEIEARKAEREERKLRLKEYAILVKDTSEMTEEQLAEHIEECNIIRQRRRNARQS